MDKPNKSDAYDSDSETTQSLNMLDHPTQPPRQVEKKRPDTQDQPAVRDRAQLIVLIGNGAGRSFTLEGQEVVIGRHPTCDIPLVTEDASRRHARIQRADEGSFVVEDLGSRNGTLVNGMPFEGKKALKYGDKIRIGAQSLFMFTQYDRLEDQLIQSQKMESIGQLAGGVAHDFNNLLGAIIANLSFLKGMPAGTTFTEKDVQASLDDIETAAARAAELTKQLLGFARRGSYESKPVEISPLVREVSHLASRTFPKSIRCDLELQPNLIVVGDPTQLHQVLMNLCINARDAMPRGGTLSITAECLFLSEEEVASLPFLMPGSYIVIAVKDTGHGMSQETLRRVFEPFFTTKGPGKGTGMGLATAYGIAKNHGGHILAESGPGQGTTFKVYLPAAEGPSKSMGTGTSAGLSIALPGTREIRCLVLVVDDEAIFRSSATRLLEGLGFGVICAADGAEAIELFQKYGETVKVVLLDMAMPKVGGVETFHALRQLKPEVKIVLNSGYAELNSVRALLAAGASGFLQKPYDAGAISAAIYQALHEA